LPPRARRAASKLHLVSADYINDRGEIVGHGFLPNGHQRLPADPQPPGAAAAGRRPARPGPARRPAGAPWVLLRHHAREAAGGLLLGGTAPGSRLGTACRLDRQGNIARGDGRPWAGHPQLGAGRAVSGQPGQPGQLAAAFADLATGNAAWPHPPRLKHGTRLASSRRRGSRDAWLARLTERYWSG